MYFFVGCKVQIFIEKSWHRKDSWVPFGVLEKYYTLTWVVVPGYMHKG